MTSEKLLKNNDFVEIPDSVVLMKRTIWGSGNFPISRAQKKAIILSTKGIPCSELYKHQNMTTAN